MALDVKYLRGTKERYEEYLKMNKIVSTNFYLLDGVELYLGKIKLSNQDDIEKALVDLNLEISEDFLRKIDFQPMLEELQIEIDDIAFDVQDLKTNAETIQNDINKFNNNKIDKINSATKNNFPIFNEKGGLIDSQFNDKSFIKVGETYTKKEINKIIKEGIENSGIVLIEGIEWGMF